MSQIELRPLVKQIVESVRVTDVHTHLFPPSFQDVQMSGADHLLTYHYLIAEAFRAHSLSYEEFWSLNTSGQAGVIWESLFVNATPLSEAAQGVVAIAQAFGCDVQHFGLQGLRGKLSSVASAAYVDDVLDRSGVDTLVMTNDPLDEEENKYWVSGASVHPRFHAALRLDRLVNSFVAAVPLLESQGYAVRQNFAGDSWAELERFLVTWVDRMKPLYCALSVSDEFDFPEASDRGRLLAELILPFCRARKLPLALMIGARRQVNPQLHSAGDGVGQASLRAIERLCDRYSENKFMVTALSRENQHELIVAARKFRNLMPFGCWWFVNTSSLVDEITRMRVELLGPTFIPQHSDARVLEQLVYKWKQTREMVTDVLVDKYAELEAMGWNVSAGDITRDVEQMFNSNFWSFVRM